jgi:hypothetical protein
MRVLLQNTETKLYFIEADQWTDDPLRATDFEEVEQAAHVYHTHHLAYAQIVIHPGASSAKQHAFEQLARQIQIQG